MGQLGPAWACPCDTPPPLNVGRNKKRTTPKTGRKKKEKTEKLCPSKVAVFCLPAQVLDICHQLHLHTAWGQNLHSAVSCERPKHLSGMLLARKMVICDTHGYPVRDRVPCCGAHCGMSTSPVRLPKQQCGQLSSILLAGQNL